MNEIKKLCYAYHDAICECCGTDLDWWINQNKHNKIYRNNSDDLFCTKKCFREYHFDSIEEVTKNVNKGGIMKFTWSDFRRIFLTIILLIFVWFGYKWALYISITFIFVGLELIGFTFRVQMANNPVNKVWEIIKNHKKKYS